MNSKITIVSKCGQWIRFSCELDNQCDTWLEMASETIIHSANPVYYSLNETTSFQQCLWFLVRLTAKCRILEKWNGPVNWSTYFPLFFSTSCCLKTVTTAACINTMTTIKLICNVIILWAIDHFCHVKPPFNTGV